MGDVPDLSKGDRRLSVMLKKRKCHIEVAK